MNWSNIRKVRMERLGLVKPAEDEKEYKKIFKKLQPVSTEYFSEPGQPPSIRYRAAFDDVEYNRHQRENQSIVKARFQGNTISYVLSEELELYAAAFVKPMNKVNDIESEFYTILSQMGPMNKQQLSEELDIKGPVVTKILQKFQKAFMIYEIQPDEFGNQVWQTFESEWPEFDISRIAKSKARRIVIRRFIENLVAVDFDMVRDWSRFTIKDTKAILEELVKRQELLSLGETDKIYFLPEDKGVVLNKKMVKLQSSVHVIHKADYIFRAYESRLKNKYKGREILQYLLIDGEIKGALEGHWRIGPHNIENVIVEMSDKEADIRKADIIKEVSRFYNLPYSKILKYNGEKTTD